MPQVGFVNADQLEREVWYGVDTQDIGDVVIETSRVAAYGVFMVSSEAGSVQVYVNNGRGWLPQPMALEDMNQPDPSVKFTTNTQAGRQYKFTGVFGAIRVVQRTAVNVEDAVLVCARVPVTS